MADKKLTDVDTIPSASGSDSLVVIKNDGSRSVKQVLISNLNIQGEGSGGGVSTSQMNSAINFAIQSHTSTADGKYATKTDIPFKFEKLTKSAYIALESKHPNTVYLIVG